MLPIRCCAPRAPQLARSYAICLKQNRPLLKNPNRVFHGEKSFQYNWYTRIIESSSTAPLLLLWRKDFTAQRMQKLRMDLVTAVKKMKRPPLPDKTVDPEPYPPPTFTVVKSSIFGVAMREYPNINISEAEQMVKGVSGGYAVLSIPIFDPKYISTIIRTLERSVPPVAPKTPEELKKEEDAKKADPTNPGRRQKRVKEEKTPELKLLGALIEGRVLLPTGVKDLTTLPSLENLQAQIVGLLSAPSAQLAAVLSQAGGGQLARTLEGLKKSLEEKGDSPPSS